MIAKILPFPTLFPDIKCSRCGFPMGKISEVAAIDSGMVTKLFGCFRCDAMTKEEASPE
jgi:hypothetical protein